MGREDDAVPVHQYQGPGEEPAGLPAGVSARWEALVAQMNTGHSVPVSQQPSERPSGVFIRAPTGLDTITSILGMTLIPITNTTLVFFVLSVLGHIDWPWWVVVGPALVWGLVFLCSMIYGIAGTVVVGEP